MLAPLGSPLNDGRVAFLPRDEKREEGRRRFDLRITVSNPPPSPSEKYLGNYERECGTVTVRLEQSVCGGLTRK